MKNSKTTKGKNKKSNSKNNNKKKIRLIYINNIEKNYKNYYKLYSQTTIFNHKQFLNY